MAGWQQAFLALQIRFVRYLYRVDLRERNRACLQALLTAFWSWSS